MGGKNKIEFRIEVQQDDIEVRGNALASGDDAEDKRCEDAIIERLNSGDVWAWACVRVVAFIPGVDLTGDAYLGACCYADEEDFKRDGYYRDMCGEAKTELLKKIEDVKKLKLA